jgi:hypothetical protein
VCVDRCVSAGRAVLVKVHSRRFHARMTTSQNTSRYRPASHEFTGKRRKAREGGFSECAAIHAERGSQRQFVIPIRKVHECVASATGVSKSAVKSIKNEMLNMQAGAATSYSTPKRNRNRPRLYTMIDDFDMCVVRRTIHEFYLHEKRLPTVKAVLTNLWGVLDTRYKHPVC